MKEGRDDNKGLLSAAARCPSSTSILFLVIATTCKDLMAGPWPGLLNMENRVENFDQEGNKLEDSVERLGFGSGER